MYKCIYHRFKSKLVKGQFFLIVAKDLDKLIAPLSPILLPLQSYIYNKN
jgi:hypothetical protein